MQLISLMLLTLAAAEVVTVHFVDATGTVALEAREIEKGTVVTSPSLSVHRQFHRCSDRRYRRRSRDKVKWIKPEKLNGHGCFDTFLVQFENCAACNEWNLTDKAALLRWSLTGTAGNCCGVPNIYHTKNCWIS